ncbi:Protein ARABIDILLO 1 [Vitis vinifera]|uniref:Protein ARABIDILLO 1 n=1 Tax=Vitis vinifera TaxID=29760 RepID=A0A438DA27_VITVI|nr:Protein ARABIDILLO 1 [Vitis vinifera]
MSRRLRRKVVKKGKEKVVLPSYPEIENDDGGLGFENKGFANWTSLPDDTVIQLFSCLNYRDRANLASTCRTWRLLGASPCLWNSLDLRAHRCDSAAAASLASRGMNLQKLRKINDATLSVIAARHEQLESLQLGPDFCEKITTDAIKAIAVCCPKLNKLRLSGVKDVHGDAIDALAKHCRNLTDLGFMDCLKVEELALGNILSLRFLSVAGTTNLKWGLISHLGNKRDVFFEWRNGKNKDKNLDMIMNWLEWALSHTLLRIAESNPQGLDTFWLKQGAALLLSLMQSSQEDVQEKAATALATFVVIDDENASIDCGRAEAVMRDGGIRLLLNLARSWREGLQSEAAKAIANLSVNANVAKAVADEGGINILSSLARSMNRSVAEEAAGGLWNLSVGEEHKGAIAEAGGVKSLVDLIFKWSAGGDGVLERAAGALANLAADDKCSMEVALAGGVHALVMLARNCKFEGVQEQAARALANLAAHGDSNSNNAAVGQEAGALEALVLLTKSPHEGVRWNL